MKVFCRNIAWYVMCPGLCFLFLPPSSLFIDKFTAASPKINIGTLASSQITYEPRGQGRSGQPLEKDAYSSKQNAEDFQAVCEKFGAKKVVLAGWYVYFSYLHSRHEFR